VITRKIFETINTVLVSFGIDIMTFAIQEVISMQLHDGAIFFDAADRPISIQHHPSHQKAFSLLILVWKSFHFLLTMLSRTARPLLRRVAAAATSRSSAVRYMSTSAASPWAGFEMGPPDPILGLSHAFHEDPSHLKIIVGVGAYRDDHGHPFVLPCVREAERIVMSEGNDHEYLGIAGDADFIDLALKFAYGDDSAPLMENRVAGVQSLSGTGGLRVMGELLKNHGHSHIYVPNPTWGNHIPIFKNSGLEVRKYHYYDAKKSDLDFDNLIKDMKDMPEGSCILLHACAHNPTG
jgi:aspartate aminotransferase